jgi:hypothetical protein
MRAPFGNCLAVPQIFESRKEKTAKALRLCVFARLNQ